MEEMDLMETERYAEWRNVVFTGALLAAVALNHDKCMTTTDGRTWEETDLGMSREWRDIAVGDDGTLIAINNNTIDAKCAISKDGGKTWTLTDMGTSARRWNSIAYGNGKFIAVAYRDNSCAISEDNGQTWTEKALGQGIQNYNSITFGAGKFVVVCYGHTLCLTSEDGKTWISGSMPKAYKWFAVKYVGGKFIATAVEESVCAVSEDGKNWTLVQLSDEPREWYGVAASDDVIVLLAGDNTIAVSKDGGATFTESTICGCGKCSYQAIAYGNGVFVAVTRGSANSSVSVDGENWELVPIGTALD